VGYFDGMVPVWQEDILVGQDTDSESTPLGAAMSWIVKLDKEQDYIGKWALEHYAQEAPNTSLVGFSSANGHVPTEGSVIVDEQGEPIGQVTSSRHSPVLDRVIGLAWVPGALARDGAQITISDEGKSAYVAYASAEQEAEACRRMGGWADVSHLGKLELQAPLQELDALVAQSADGATLELGRATRAADAWWCPLTRSRALVICDPAALPALRDQINKAAQTAAPSSSVVEVTTIFAAITLPGPVAPEVFARFSAIDLRPQSTPVGGLRPGSIGRQPATLICEAPDRFLFLFGWAIGEYMWSIVQDAGEHLGARPIGVDGLALVGDPAPEAATQHA
jgi:glycine cleavage system aminomethyltransferase T